jgi:deoxycytidine triphosphate deaminase
VSLVHSKNHVTNIDEKSIQPNAVDIRCSRLLEIKPDKTLLISESGPKEFSNRWVVPVVLNSPDGIQWWTINKHSSYEFETEHEVTIPEGMAGWLVIRSTLSRNGIIMSGGVFDSGFSGLVGGTIHNLTSGNIRLEKNCRIGQFIMVNSETSHLYDGHYNNNGGRSVA